ncbi:hypothetical protein M569_13605, partial [Genlisea aurea]
VRLFDSHCHFQDPRTLKLAPKLIKESLDLGVTHFAVNGVSENDWHLVKQMSETYPCVIPNFGLHPLFISDRTSNWMETLNDFLTATPSAGVGEIGLDKGSVGKQIDFSQQVEVFCSQLRLAKALKRPASVHCVRAYGHLLEILKREGPFPHGVVLHSYLGSAEMVSELSKLGAYFSFSGFLMSLKESKARKVVKSVPGERILLETDSPDGKPPGSVPSVRELEDDDDMDTDMLNHPANILAVLGYVAAVLGMEEKEVAELSYRNALRVFNI